MNIHKKWCIGTLLTMVLMLGAIAAITIYVDPFFHYHRPFDKIPYILNNEGYQNPGIVRHFEYNALITGSSMTQNFKPSYFAEVLGVNTIKVPYSGGNSKNMNIIIKKALENNPNLRTVYLGLDSRMLETKDINETVNPLPAYLYDVNPFDDVSYLFNKDVLFNRVRSSIIGALKGSESTSLDSYSYWQDGYTFSQYTVIDSNMDWQRRAVPGYALEETIRIADNNLRNNILPLIEAYPGTKFIVFYPPYSILYWYLTSIGHNLGVLEYSVKTLLSYKNVELFFFQNNAEIVTNLYNYKDYTHYSADINAYMVDCFKNGAHKLTSENYMAELEKMRSLAENFDVGIFFGESNPFIRENNFSAYLDKLNNTRYIVFVAAQTDSPMSAHDIFGSQYRLFGLDNSENACGYAAVLNGSNPVYQAISDNTISFADIVNGLSVNIISEKRDDANYIEVVINGVTYTTNQPGVNIVVYDTELRRVMDNIALNIKNGAISRR